MSDQPAPKPEDQDQDSPLVPREEPPVAKPSGGVPVTLFLAVLMIFGFLFMIPSTRTSGQGATLSAKQVQAERERQVQEALRAMNETEAAR